MKKLILSTALVLIGGAAIANGSQDCANGSTCHYNDASINKGDTDNSLTNGDHLNNTYAPDSATSNSNASVGDIITQGGSGTGGDAQANGNKSENHNQSSANNSLSNQQFGNSQNANSATASGGAVSGSGNSTNKNAQGQQQVATGGKSTQGQTQSNANAVNNNIDASTRVKHAASTAISSSIQGCGGTAGGGFSAAIQTFGWGVSAARCKGDRFEQVIIAEQMARNGNMAAAAYLAAVDPSARKAMVAIGVVEDRSTPSGRRAAQAKAQVTQQVTQQVTRCPEGSRWDGKGCWAPNLKKVRR